MGDNGNFEAFHNLARRYVLGGLSSECPARRHPPKR